MKVGTYVARVLALALQHASSVNCKLRKHGSASRVIQSVLKNRQVRVVYGNKSVARSMPPRSLRNRGVIFRPRGSRSKLMLRERINVEFPFRARNCVAVESNPRRVRAGTRGESNREGQVAINFAMNSVRQSQFSRSNETCSFPVPLYHNSSTRVKKQRLFFQIRIFLFPLISCTKLHT